MAKNTTKEKVRKRSKPVVKIYVNQNGYHKSERVWKTVVENSVENVEKLEFSTGIPMVWKHWAQGRRMHIRLHNSDAEMVARTLCRRCQPEFSSATLAKKLVIHEKPPDKGRALAAWA